MLTIMSSTEACLIIKPKWIINVQLEFWLFSFNLWIKLSLFESNWILIKAFVKQHKAHHANIYVF